MSLPDSGLLLDSVSSIEAGIWALVILSFLRTIIVVLRFIYGDKRRFN